MWPTLTDNLTTVVAALTGLAALFGAWLRLKPRRLIGWLSAVKEREILFAMLEHERAWGLYWKTQAQQCIEQFQKEFHVEAIAERDNESPAGFGRTSSKKENGPSPEDHSTGQTQKGRLTG